MYTKSINKYVFLYMIYKNHCIIPIKIKNTHLLILHILAQFYTYFTHFTHLCIFIIFKIFQISKISKISKI